MEGKIGAVGEFDVKQADGIVSADATVGKFGISIGVVAKIDVKALVGDALDLVAKAIPGTFDDAAIAVLKQPLEDAVAAAVAKALAGAGI